MKKILTITENLNSFKKDINKYNDGKTDLTKEKKILSVISNKGGVGKTSIACCMSLYFSKIIKKKTLLVELDCSPGDFGTLFDIDRDKTLEMALGFQKDYKKYIKSINRNLDVLKGISDPIAAESIKSHEVKSFIKKIKEDFDYIVLDTQTVLNGVLLDFIKASNMLFLISDCTMESIARVSKFLEFLNSRFMIDKDKFRIIINKKSYFSYFHFWELSRLLDFPIESLIYFDKSFNKSDIFLNEQKILKTRFFKQLRKTLENIGKNI
jgi:cellulose biosynthesis protein BcsQ